MTNATENLTALDQDGFQSFMENRSEPEWISEMRRSAWDLFCQMGWPTRRDEEWMRTDIRLFKLNKFAMPAAPLGSQPASVLDQGVDLAGRVVALDGLPQHSELDPDIAKQGVVFGGIVDIMREHGDRLKPFFNRAFDPAVDRFSALHSAFWSSGCVLYVPRGVVVEKPLHSFSGMSEGGVDLGHTLVILEDGAEATLLAESASDTETSTGFHCGGVELMLGDQANLRYVNLQDWGQGAWHFAHQKATVGRDSHLQWTSGALGSRLSKVNQHVELNGEGANCQVNGVMFTENKQHLSYHTLQQHKAPHCTSDFLYKAALQDRSRTVWRGMIKVDEGAQKTDGFQRNDNLLLSTQARADSIPGLEIEADDVRCTHGSTSGRVDEELVFYARSRGFTRKEAIQMIVTGFFQQVFDRVTIESVREALGQAISRRVREYE